MPSMDSEVRAERVSAAFQQVPVAVIVMVVNALLIAAVLVDAEQDRGIYIWLALIASVSAARLASWYAIISVLYACKLVYRQRKWRVHYRDSLGRRLGSAVSPLGDLPAILGLSNCRHVRRCRRTALRPSFDSGRLHRSGRPSLGNSLYYRGVASPPCGCPHDGSICRRVSDHGEAFEPLFRRDNTAAL